MPPSPKICHPYKVSLYLLSVVSSLVSGNFFVIVFNCETKGDGEPQVWLFLG